MLKITFRWELVAVDVEAVTQLCEEFVRTGTGSRHRLKNIGRKYWLWTLFFRSFVNVLVFFQGFFLFFRLGYCGRCKNLKRPMFVLE